MASTIATESAPPDGLSGVHLHGGAGELGSVSPFQNGNEARGAYRFHLLKVESTGSCPELDLALDVARVAAFDFKGNLQCSQNQQKARFHKEPQRGTTSSSRWRAFFIEPAATAA
jgi:hypothetical protein